MSHNYCALLTVVLAAPFAFAQKSPEETVKSMTVADGLQVELFAAEPMLINPTSIDVDHLGRVWVCEAVNYRRKNFGRPILRPEGDRIVILTDTRGEGKADQSTVFYQGPELYGPIGIAVAASPNPEKKGAFSYKVFVCQSPDILLFEDKDGDGKADGPPKKFLTGFRGFDHDHGVHGINIGPDGKLYFTVGDQGVDGLQSSDGKGRKWKSGTPDCQAGTVWRCDMDGKNLELIAHNFRNNYEACVNSFGEVWLSDNDDDGNQQTRICYVMPGGNYGYFPRGPGQSHWHEEQPGIVHKTLRTGFGSPTGICFYEGTLLPEKYRGQLLHTDAGPREFRCFHVKPKGAGYELEKENLITSTDTWFRLSDVCVAPDGSVMLADWYDPGVGGHGMGDWTRGRIYRVTPKGHKGYKVPVVNLGTKEGLLAALGSPNQATRYLAIKQLASLSPLDRVLALAPGVTSDIPSLQARAIWQVDHRDMEAVGPKVDQKLKDQWQAATVRQLKLAEFVLLVIRAAPGYVAATAAEDKHSYEKELADWAGAFLDGAKPASLKSDVGLGETSVLRELLCVLRAADPQQLAPIFFQLAKKYDGQDIFYRAALNIACGTDPKRREAILADFDKHFSEWNDKVADLVWELRPASSLARLPKLLEDPKLTAAQKGRIVDILAVYDDANAGKTMLQIVSGNAPAEIKARAIENLKTFLPTKWKDLAKSDDLTKAIDALLKDPNAAVTGLQLVAATNAVDRVDAVATLAGDHQASRPVQLEALRTLGKLRTLKSVEALRAIASDMTFSPTPATGLQAINSLGTLVTGQAKDEISAQALAALQEQLPRNDYPELQKAALSALAGSQAGTQWLLDMAAKKKLPESLVADAGRLLRNSPFAGERNKAMLLFPPAGRLDPKKLPPIAELVKRKGDVKRGESILMASVKSEAQCLRCHTVRGVGGHIGPDQSMVGKKASRENLYESILMPSKAIADQYVQWKVNTLDGKSITGLLVAESETSLTLRDANGKDYVIPTKDLDGPKQKSLVSIMPDNLVSALTEDELVDLVEYLLTLKTASLTPESWHVLGPFANDAQDSALDNEIGIERAKEMDLGAKFKSKDGDVKWGTVAASATGYVDLAAHHGPRSPMSASYLYRAVESPADQGGSILFGNDDGAKVWVNGEKVFENRDHFAATPGKHTIPVKLKKGPNAVLIKIVNGSDPHGFYFALTSEQELKLSK
jgi:putative membrane-bound dehydrogenase-like protein